MLTGGHEKLFRSIILTISSDDCIAPLCRNRVGRIVIRQNFWRKLQSILHYFG